MPGYGELLVILLIIIIVFGGSKLPQLGDAIGRSIKNFKSAMREEPENTTNKEKNNDADTNKPPQA